MEKVIKRIAFDKNDVSDSLEIKKSLIRHIFPDEFKYGLFWSNCIINIDLTSESGDKNSIY